VINASSLFPGVAIEIRVETRTFVSLLHLRRRFSRAAHCHPDFEPFFRHCYSCDGITYALVEAGQREVVLVSLGAAGAVLATAEGCVRYRTPAVPILSKVGAGDSMVGGLVLALARGESLVKAVRFSIAAGSAAVVMTPRFRTLRREDTESLYAHR
jgi:sugar/nucleoside kinase (ribokinase family)